MIGQTLGHYTILEKLGEGGMGIVYLGQDTKLDRKVALKLLPEKLSQDETARRRFLREAKSAAAIDHPYVCKIYEVGEAEGKGFIAMEFIEGQTLHEKLETGPLALGEGLHLATEIAEAFEKAHREEIVHRDLKPANVMVTVDGHIKVMDFGLAKRVFSEEGVKDAETLTEVTQAGAVLGTLAYMSPEQIRGEPADQRSDIFSFGIVLYEMLAGAHPFKKPAVPETWVGILSGDAPPLERHDVPDSVRDAVAKMLAKDPAARYQSFGEVLRDLRSVAGGPSIAAQGKGVSKLRKPFLALAALVGLVLALVALKSWLPSAGTETQNLDVADLKVMEYQSTAESLMQDFGDPESLRMSLEAWQKVADLKPDYPPALAGMATARTLVAWNSKPDPQLLDQAEKEAEEAIKLDPQLATPYSALSFIYSMRGLFDTAEEMSRRSLELAPSDPWILQTRARFLIDMHGNFEEAERLSRQATELDPGYFPAWFQLGWALMEQRRFEEAEIAFSRANQLRPDFLAGFLGTALVFDLTGRHEKALESFNAALEIDPDSVQVLFFRGLTYHRLGRFDQALKGFQAVLTTSPDHPLSSHARQYEALELKNLGRLEEYVVALEGAERTFKGNLMMWFNLWGMAGVASQQGDYEAALAWLEQAVETGMKSVNRILQDPALDPLHDDPRFQEIVNRIRASEPPA